MFIGNHKRFAVRRVVTLAEGQRGHRRGLLFELSLSGCRISHLDDRAFEQDERVKIHVPGFGELEGNVRMARGGAIVLRYPRPLHSAVLGELLHICRQGEDGAVPALAAARA